ncbi:MAG: hypothetical protein H7A21_10245 [Spirochaetales bacterium]|nr:hypothetical protein [Leptospiraceae bacterium]MCP5481803.1 hypothetical protein [Spirochaetales bacterium]MCP5486919.1 hypothetical protein [Spirochaetales bacterium]
MQYVILVIQGIGGLGTFIGILGFVNTLFDLSLRWKGTDLPNDYVSATAILVFGLVFAGLGFLFRNRGR